MFDTKIAIVIRDDLASWQKLNVTAFLTSGVLGSDAALLGENYEDASGRRYAPLLIQPVVVLTTDAAGLTKIHGRAQTRQVRAAVYIEDMFQTGHDAANRETLKRYETEALPLVGLGFREERKLVDKITKGAKLHS